MVRASAACGVTVYDVLSYLAAGMTIAEILDDFPYLTPEDIQACFAFAAERERNTSAEEAPLPARLTAEQRAELSQRDAELDTHPEIAMTWEQIRASVEAKPRVSGSSSTRQRMMALSTDTVEIYVPLLNEGTDVLCPTKGLVIRPNIIQVIATADYDPTIEEWEFPPGCTVRCVTESKGGRTLLVARSRIV